MQKNKLVSGKQEWHRSAVTSRQCRAPFWVCTTRCKAGASLDVNEHSLTIAFLSSASPSKYYFTKGTIKDKSNAANCGQPRTSFLSALPYRL